MSFEIKSKPREELEIILSSKLKSGFIYYLLIFLSVCCFLFPLSLFLFEQLSIGFGYIITLCIFWGTSFFFMRKALWNKFGKEIYTIKKGELNCTYDYRLYKDNLPKKEFKKLTVNYRVEPNGTNYNINESTKDDCYIVFLLNGSEVVSTIPVSYENIVITAQLTESIIVF